MITEIPSTDKSAIAENNLKSTDLEDASCPLGCSKLDDIILSGHDRLHDLPGEFTVVKCRTCGLMRTNPRPTPKAIGFYYPDNYGPYLGTQVAQSQLSPPSTIKNFFKPFVRRLFNTKADALPSLPPGRLLEIGCASGAFLHRMAISGWQVEGIEFSEKAANAARELGYNVYVGSLEGAETRAKPFDLIVGWMVLEHLHDPVRGLQKLHEWASHNAWLVLSIPNANAFEFKIFKDKWYALQLPNHLYHYTPRTLAKVLEAGGWSLEKVHHQRSLSNLIVSTAYVVENQGWPRLGAWLRVAGRGGKWFYLLFPIAWVLGVTGQSGRMTVWARKNQVHITQGER